MLYLLSPRERSPIEREKEKRIFRIFTVFLGEGSGGAFSIGRLRRPSSSSVNNFQFITKQRIPIFVKPIARLFPVYHQSITTFLPV